MTSEIKSKLLNALSEPIKREDQVIFILSRIRKFLESEGQKSAYSRLVFFCDWALHSRLDRLRGDALEMLRRFVNGEQEDFLELNILKDELNRFFNDFQIETSGFFESENYANFVKKLVEVYSDTPVTISIEETKTIDFMCVENEGRSHLIHSIR